MNKLISPDGTVDSRLEIVQQRYQDLSRRNLQLDMTRGKPSPEQLDLSNDMMTMVNGESFTGADGTDCRNYGIGTGIPEARELFAEFMDVLPTEIIVGGNASLTLMYDALAGALLFGMPGGDGPWCDQGKLKFLCPVPGYDRHFAICERLGIEMINVEMADDGPDMDFVEKLVENDASIKGIWCVPKYSNPTGATYSDTVVDRLAGLRPAATDFRIFWDNAYAVHHLGDGPARVKNILSACKSAGNPELPLMFGSTSKITHAGSGVAMLAASVTNITDAAEKMSFSSIGPDKINQLRHVRYFGNFQGILTHMEKQAASVAPKFAAVDAALERHLAGKGFATWTRPQGGYFVSVDVMDGCAAEIIELAGKAGVKLTPAGATFPYGCDVRDRNIRLAPTMPSVYEIEQAMEVFCACVELVCTQKRE